jgi:histidine triad (HIT) family protein
MRLSYGRFPRGQRERTKEEGKIKKAARTALERSLDWEDSCHCLFAITDRQSNRMKTYLGLLGLGALLFVQAVPLVGQQIPASDLPPPGTDTGLEGKYDPQNGIAQLIRDKSSESAASKIFEDEHVLVFMPLPEEEVVVPGHVLVVPKRLGARNLLDLKPEEMCALLAAVQKAGIAQKNGLGATGFRVQSNNGLSSSQTVYHSHFHVIPSFGGKAPGTPAPRRKLPEAEYNEIAAKLRAAWPK